MTKRMMIDASHAEETRVVVLDGNRLEDFDVETSTKRQLKGNIYLAKVVRVEPSLQAAFVEYGGNRHGFLAFSEIHPDYYQIPVADRQRLIEMEAEEARREQEEEDRAAAQPAGHAEVPHETEPAKSEPGEEAESTEAAAEATSEADISPPWWSSPGTAADTNAPEATAAETGDASAATEAVTQTAEPEPAVGTSEQPTAGTADKSGVTVTDLSTGAPEPAERVAVAEPAAVEASDESAATAATPNSTEPQDQAPATAASPVAVTGDDSGTVPDTAEPPAQAVANPPAAETADESGATGATQDAAEPPDDPKPAPRSRQRAQPLIIEGETLSGPVETDEEPAEAISAGADLGTAATANATAQDTSTAEPHSAAAMAPRSTETIDEPGAAAAMPAEDTVAEQRAEPPRRSRRRANDEVAPFGEVEAEAGEAEPEAPPPETLGGEPDGDERAERRIPPRFLRNYKIQEVIKRRQIMLVQVVKEERGTKGAALTTYLSLAGRFCVLMPNSPRGGGISRKITSATDRRRLKEIVTEMDMPKGMGLIVRTAGAQRPKPEIRRDCEYLLRLWDDIREHTLKSVAPALIYEEASLIKRAIRDVYSRDVDEILVDGEDGWRAAHDFMRMLMPSHAKKVQLWRDGGQPLFARYQVEAQLDSMLLPTVQLRSGGYLVINQTEALVAIDVNSGRSTRERNVEETALRTNLEAADEAARQLRLRDLAGLIVIDFIDMESKKHNAMVERRVKEALKNDRARIQVGHISHFGLLEMSRQRLRPSLAETSFISCPHCGGTGHVRSTESAALHVLRGIEEEGSKRRAAEIVVHVATPIALYILNHKRDRLHEIELRYAMRVTLSGDNRQIEPQFRIDRVRPQVAGAVPAVVTPDMMQPAPQPALETAAEEQPDAEETAEAEDQTEAVQAQRPDDGEAAEDDETDRRRRRRRRRRRTRHDESPESPPPEAQPAEAGSVPAHEIAEAPAASGEESEPEGPIETHIEGVPEHLEPGAAGEEEEARSRRRGRRGGRRRRREPDEAEPPVAAPGTEQPELPSYSGPTPANPFGGHAFDIFDMLEQAEGVLGAGPPNAPAPEVTTITTEPESEAAVAAEPAPDALEAIVNTTAPEPVAEEAVREAQATEPAGEEAGEPVAEHAAAITEHPAASGEASPEPLVKPIIVGGAEEPPAERKRGWWRR